MPLIALLAAVALFYGLGASRLGGRSGVRPVRWPPPLAMIAALLTIYIALASRLDELAEDLLSMHMVQHLILMLIAAPLLILAHPLPSLLWSLPRQARRGCGRLLNSIRRTKAVRLILGPLSSWTLFCGLLIFWHIPTVYRWALGGEFRHALMHVSFLVGGLAFWASVIGPRSRRLDNASGALFVFSAALVTGLPGALIAFARQPLYLLSPYHALPFGLTPLADQQLAGLIMWIPMDLIFFAVSLTRLGISISGRNQTPQRRFKTATRSFLS